jgi:hypothetical protein
MTANFVGIAQSYSVIRFEMNDTDAYPTHIQFLVCSWWQIRGQSPLQKLFFGAQLLQERMLIV